MFGMFGKLRWQAIIGVFCCQNKQRGKRVCSQRSRSDAFSSPSMIFSGWIFCIDILYLPIVEVKHYGPIVADTKYKIYNNMSIF